MKRFGPLLSALAVASALVSAPAWADRPPAGPRQATQVQYHVENAQSMMPADFTVLFAPGGRKARVSFAGQVGYLLLDMNQNRVTMVMDQPKISMNIPTPALLAPYFNWRETLDFTRGGVERDGGRVCQIWDTTTPKGRAELCVTSDGLPLRVHAVGRDGTRSDVIAQAVQPGPSDQAVFEVPPDHPNLGNSGFSPFGGSGEH